MVDVMRYLRSINWRFVLVFGVAFTVVLAGFLGVYAGFAAVHESNVKTSQVNTLITQGKARDAAFNADRDVLLSDVSALLAYTEAISKRADQKNQQFSDLLTYLRVHGISIPTRFITETPPVKPPRLVSIKPKGGGAGHKPSKHPGGH